MQEDFLIVGLGNPGLKYEKTRHNLGFMVVQALAEKQGLPFKRGWRIKGKIAGGVIGGKKVHILMPSTYMNLSGEAVRKCLGYYRIPLQNLLVVVDDVYLKLGTMRLREKGSPGGHNGLKSIEAHLRTQEYSRLRMGVGGESLSESVLEAYVLGNFNTEEQKILPDVIEAGANLAACWVIQGIEPAKQLAGELKGSL
ncbi:MAG: aminoacyl-tRNA hydrolase [Chlamydiales bacterium]|nr:aminoacyl-tRNA hydrolase [Chlamydiales bacterium]